MQVTFTDLGQYHGKNAIVAIIPIEAIVGRRTFHIVVEHALHFLAVGGIRVHGAEQRLFGLATGGLTLLQSDTTLDVIVLDVIDELLVYHHHVQKRLSLKDNRHGFRAVGMFEHLKRGPEALEGCRVESADGLQMFRDCDLNDIATGDPYSHTAYECRLHLHRAVLMNSGKHCVQFFIRFLRTVSSVCVLGECRPVADNLLSFGPLSDKDLPGKLKLLLISVARIYTLRLGTLTLLCCCPGFLAMLFGPCLICVWTLAKGGSVELRRSDWSD